MYNIRMGRDEDQLTLEDLAALTGVPTRTIRYYIAEGLLPAPEGRGKATVYSEGHMLRLRLVRLLAEHRLPLAEIRQLLAGLTDEDIRPLLREQEQITSEMQRLAKARSPKDYISPLLNRAREEPAIYGPREAQRAFVRRPAASLPPGNLSFEDPACQVDPLASPGPASIEGNGTWYRWEIQPGVELHIRSDLVDRYRYLIDILQRAAGETDV